ncbi:efflux RND transporter periplasmic adaptor subunit [Cobetia marina]|uniref:efflux RND transporter periplasmic adaptor subunit n=1 Tax=Cobetia marina TaxID=28258 RepID=UPI002549A6CA|nr:efflux RND transporter periplasmic adaptor subunit [Cobetia pacifica]MDI6002015.1 efflux RND transporter periplasmic adaptor subunit [Cobetia pacifica]
MPKLRIQRRPALWSAGLLLMGALLTGCNEGGDADPSSAQAQSAPRATEVEALTVTAQDIPITNELAGRTSAYQSSEVRPQVGGVIQSRDFTEGSVVEEGQVLYHIDPRTYQADVDSAKASLERAQATLHTSQLQAKRYKTLVARKMVSQQDYDDAIATVGEDTADVTSAKAALKSAQINLDYTTVKAAISGRIGKSSVTKGALVTASQDTALATIQQLDPIYVDVTQSANDILRIKRELASNGKAASAPDMAMVELIFDDGSRYEHQGKLQFTDVSVDQSTGMVTLRALFPNPDELLLPGMFVKARLVESVARNAILVPQKAVSRDSDGKATALVINDENKVERRELVTGQAIDHQWIVLQGLKTGDRVITSGLQKIQEGATVTVAEDETTGSNGGNESPAA